MMTCWRGLSVSASLCRCWISETIVDISKTHSDPTRPAPAFRSRGRRWTSPAAVRHSCHRRRYKTPRVLIWSTTSSSSESLSTLLIWWTHDWSSSATIRVLLSVDRFETWAGETPWIMVHIWFFRIRYSWPVYTCRLAAKIRSKTLFIRMLRFFTICECDSQASVPWKVKLTRRNFLFKSDSDSSVWSSAYIKLWQYWALRFLPKLCYSSKMAVIVAHYDISCLHLQDQDWGYNLD